MDFNLKSGVKGEKKTSVTDRNTAEALGSGGLPVFATPAMIALMEGACVAAVDPALPEGFSTVGTGLDLRHTAATPLGMTVRAVGELTEMNGKELRFRVEAFDDAGKIGDGLHTRFIIENEKFLKKTLAKLG
ncbi:MAG: thioesterase family protein [Spirochaetaceae bacterium]|jgi:predicted thioesterase|nr:thioesterase family protein [Spirochaetaceae bacterium]